MFSQILSPSLLWMNSWLDRFFFGSSFDFSHSIQLLDILRMWLQSIFTCSLWLDVWLIIDFCSSFFLVWNGWKSTSNLNVFIILPFSANDDVHLMAGNIFWIHTDVRVLCIVLPHMPMPIQCPNVLRCT